MVDTGPQTPSSPSSWQSPWTPWGPPDPQPVCLPPYVLGPGLLPGILMSLPHGPTASSLSLLSPYYPPLPLSPVGQSEYVCVFVCVHAFLEMPRGHSLTGTGWIGPPSISGSLIPRGNPMGGRGWPRTGDQPCSLDRAHVTCPGPVLAIPQGPCVPGGQTGKCISVATAQARPQG